MTVIKTLPTHEVLPDIPTSTGDGHTQYWCDTTIADRTKNYTTTGVVTVGQLQVSAGLVSLYSSIEDDTNKVGRLVVKHYDIDEEDVNLITGLTNNAANVLHFGGGSAGFNSVTSISFYTGTDFTTEVGTKRLEINSSGDFIDN